MSYTALLGIGVGIIFSQTPVYRTLKETVLTYYGRWRSLTDLVATTEESNLRIISVSVKMVVQTWYITLLQYMNTAIRKVDRKTYEVSYVIDGRMYKMLVVPKRGPAPVLQISDDESNDVTEQILPYMGPQYDWHGHKFTPQFFGHESLTFELMDGSEHTYGEDSHISHVAASTRYLSARE